MIKRINTFIRLKPQLKIMILQAFAFSIYTWFLFAFFNRYARFGKTAPPTPLLWRGEKAIPGTLLIPPEGEEKQPGAGTMPTQGDHNASVDHIAKAIQIASKYIPWKNVCRHQAYQAKMLCSFYKIPYQVFIGFKKDKEKNEIQAHAWTIAGGKIITGFCNPEEYIVQSIYRNKWQ